MKSGIHPNYNKATVVCNCGNEFETGSKNLFAWSLFTMPSIPYWTTKAATARDKLISLIVDMVLHKTTKIAEVFIKIGWGYIISASFKFRYCQILGEIKERY